MAFRTSAIPVLLAMCPVVFCQTASLSGQLTDTSGAVLPDALVAATNERTNQQSRAQTNREGRRGDYVRRRQVTANGTYDLPVGRGARGSNSRAGGERIWRMARQRHLALRNRTVRHPCVHGAGRLEQQSPGCCVRGRGKSAVRSAVAPALVQRGGVCSGSGDRSGDGSAAVRKRGQEHYFGSGTGRGRHADVSAGSLQPDEPSQL
jgi:hypothetical protein